MVENFMNQLLKVIIYNQKIINAPKDFEKYLIIHIPKKIISKIVRIIIP